MLENAAIADMLDEIADLLAFDDANPFRVRAYRNGARTVRRYGQAMHELVAEGADLTELPAIGKDLAALIDEAVNSGRMRTLDALRRSAPIVAGELMSIEGIGPKKARALWQALGVRSIEQLHRAVLDERVREVDGFGPVSEARLAEVLAGRLPATGRRLPIADAAPVAKTLRAYLAAFEPVAKVEIAGSYRRGRETVGDLDVVVQSSAPDEVIAHLKAWDRIARTVSAGGKKATVILDTGLQVDLRVCGAREWGSMLHYFTGSKAHSIQLRRLARRQGRKLNEYGLWEGSKRIAGASEADVYEALGLQFIPPELRENRGEIELAAEDALPRLVTLKRLKGDLHAIAEEPDAARALIRAAAERGFDYLALGPHLSASSQSGAMDESSAAALFEAIGTAAKAHTSLTVLKSVEVDILKEGRLDLPDWVGGMADLVIGSVQAGFELSRAAQTRRLRAALDDPCLAILSHPSGRIVAERPPYDVDMEAVAELAAARNVALELSADPRRLDLTDSHCQTAIKAGAMVAISAEARRPEDFDRLALGVTQARRGWVSASHTLNARPLTQIKDLLANHRLNRAKAGAA